MANIPPPVLDFIQNLSPQNQEALLKFGARAATDPMFLSLTTIPALFALAYIPHFAKLGVTIPLLNLRYNNQTPRLTDYEKELKSKTLGNFVARCTGAHQNTFEALVGYAPALLLCKINKADGVQTRNVAMRFMKLRVLYLVLYLASFNDVVAGARTLVWTASIAAILELYKLAFTS